MTLPSVLICAPIRYRPECPEVLGEYLDALAALEWPRDRVEYRFVLHADGECSTGEDAWDDLLERPWAHFEQVQAPCSADSRLIASRGLPGPRTTKETQLNLAYLRSRLFHYWEHQTEADLCLMVDSDVVLHPSALRRMEGIMLGAFRSDCEEFHVVKPGEKTVTLQLDNRFATHHEPHSNGSMDDGARAPWATDGSVVEVARAGACTLYPRAAACYRFTFDPTRYNEEHQGLFDRLAEDGFRHYLLRDPALADHRMRRLDFAGDAEWLAANRTDTSPGGIFVEEDP